MTDLAQYEKRELAIKAIDSSIVEITDKIEHFEAIEKTLRDADRSELKGLELAKELILSDELAYLDGVEAGLDLARSRYESKQ